MRELGRCALRCSASNESIEISDVLGVSGSKNSSSLVQMEKMQITILSVRQCNGTAVVRACATARKARIHLEVGFESSKQRDIWDEARLEVLRFLDIA